MVNINKTNLYFFLIYGFVIRFLRQDVVIDDRLPVYSDNSLVFCHNKKDKREFFGPLLEKAYAKLCGCYQFMNGGWPSDAMTDLSGAVCETFDLKMCAKISDQEEKEDEYEYEDEDEYEYEDEEYNEDEEDEFDDDAVSQRAIELDSLWKLMLRAFRMKSLMNASVDYTHDDDEVDENGVLPTGLVTRHAYSVRLSIKS